MTLHLIKAHAYGDVLVAMHARKTCGMQVNVINMNCKFANLTTLKTIRWGVAQHKCSQSWPFLVDNNA